MDQVDPSMTQVRDLEDDHEKYAGEVMADPWSDSSQTDWPDAAPVLDADEDADDDTEEPEEDPA